jgi:hypothetical protein
MLVCPGATLWLFRRFRKYGGPVVPCHSGGVESLGGRSNSARSSGRVSAASNAAHILSFFHSPRSTLARTIDPANILRLVSSERLTFASVARCRASICFFIVFACFSLVSSAAILSSMAAMFCVLCVAVVWHFRPICRLNESV